MTEPLIRRVRIRNYRSIADCDVALYPFTLLVGRNGSGKSNFLDALRFVSDGLRTSLDHAVRDRGGIDAVRRRGTGHPHNFAIMLELNLPNGTAAQYGFEIASLKPKGFEIREEIARIVRANGAVEAAFRVESGRVISPETALHPAADGILMDSLREAAETTQIVVTTHSPDLLDRFDPESDSLLAVASDKGTTVLGPIDEASMDSIRKHLHTAGELLRMDQMEPVAAPVETRRSLFEESEST